MLFALSKKKRSRAVRLIDVCALVVASGMHPEAPIWMCTYYPAICAVCRDTVGARAMMLVCLEIVSVSRAVRGFKPWTSQ